VVKGLWEQGYFKTNIMNKNIEDLLYPDNNKLVFNDDEITTTIVDCELDEYECRFNGAEDIQINTEGYTHITLDINILESLIALIRKAEKMYKQNN
jgi:hypothetical protein